MAGSRSPSRSARSSKKKARSSERWLDDEEDDDINYDRANEAVRNLATWALDIAERDAADSPEALRRVRNTRRFVLGRLDGRRERRTPIEDVVFTASLLARIFDDDLGLNLSDAFTIFDTLDLPTELIAVPPPRRPTSPIAHRAARAPRSDAYAPPPLRLCDECGYVHEYGLHVGRRNAA